MLIHVSTCLVIADCCVFLDEFCFWYLIFFSSLVLLDVRVDIHSRIKDILNQILHMSPLNQFAIDASESIHEAACECLAAGFVVFYPSPEDQRQLLLGLLKDALIEGRNSDAHSPSATLLYHLLIKLRDPASALHFLPAFFHNSSNSGMQGCLFFKSLNFEFICLMFFSLSFCLCTTNRTFFSNLKYECIW